MSYYMYYSESSQHCYFFFLSFMLFIQVESFSTDVILWILNLIEEKCSSLTMAKSSVTATIQRTHSRQGSMSVLQIIQVIAATSLIWLLLDICLFYSSGFMGQDHDLFPDEDNKLPIEKRLSRDRKLKDNSLKFIPHKAIHKSHDNVKLIDSHRIKSNENIMQHLGDDGGIPQKIESKMLQKQILLEKLNNFKRREPSHEIAKEHMEDNVKAIGDIKEQHEPQQDDERTHGKGCTDDLVPCKANENKDDAIENNGDVNPLNEEVNNQAQQVWHNMKDTSVSFEEFYTYNYIAQYFF